MNNERSSLNRKLHNIIDESGYSGLFLRALERIKSLILDLFKYAVDYFHCTYIEKSSKESGQINQIIMESLSKKDFESSPEPIITRYLSHQFDLLGSGWIKIHHGMKAVGLESYRYLMGEKINLDNGILSLSSKVNSSNATASRKILELIDSSYIPIDWQIDFKSGYRWSEKTWHKFIKHGHKKGVDIKTPWELARMQHLPLLAISYLDKERKEKNKHLFPLEFRNQVLDFIANNPPNFGVNWACAMDVSIRVSNWLVAYDLFCSKGFNFDEDFRRIFKSSILSHARYILSNLEWRNEVRGNHYLANISGLVFISCYLPSNSETDSWLAFSIQELIEEVKHQFHKDGSNFESSTAYHRLSTEMIIFSTAIILGLSKERIQGLKIQSSMELKTKRKVPRLKAKSIKFYEFPNYSKSDHEKSPFPKSYFEKIEKMIEFIKDIKNNEGQFPQIGDNDNGRFFKFQPKYDTLTVNEAKKKYSNLDSFSELANEEIYFMEKHLECSNIIQAGNALFNQREKQSFKTKPLLGYQNLDKLIIYEFIKNTKIGSQRRRQGFSANKLSTKEAEKKFEKIFSMTKSNSEEIFLFNKYKFQASNLLEGLTLKSYPDFGVYIFKSKKLYLTVRCWSGTRAEITNHMHFDQLSIELIIEGKKVASDPGTYIYEALPEKRFLFRSDKYHNGPKFKRENISPFLDVFSPIKPLAFQSIYFGEKGFYCQNNDFKSEIVYLLKLDSNQISIFFSNKGDVLKGKGLDILQSPGYGIIHSNNLIKSRNS